MDGRDVAPRCCRVNISAAVMALGTAAVLGWTVRASAAEPLSRSAVATFSGDASPNREGLLLGEPLLSSSYPISDLSPILFVAHRDGGTQGNSAGSAQAAVRAGMTGSDGIMSGNPGASNVIVGSGWRGARQVQIVPLKT